MNVCIATDVENVIFHMSEHYKHYTLREGKPIPTKCRFFHVIDKLQYGFGCFSQEQNKRLPPDDPDYRIFISELDVVKRLETERE